MLWLGLPNLKIVSNIVIMWLLLQWKMKEQDEVPGSRNCSSANRKSLPENGQGGGDVEITRLLTSTSSKAKINHLPLLVSALALSHCLPRERRHVAQSFFIPMHPFTGLGNGLKIEKIWIKGHPYCCHPSSFPSKSYGFENNFEHERGLPYPIHISGGSEPLMWLSAACLQLWLNRFDLEPNGFGKETQWEESQRRRQRTRFLYSGSGEKLKESDAAHFALLDGYVLMKASFQFMRVFWWDLYYSLFLVSCALKHFSLLRIENF